MEFQKWRRRIYRCPGSRSSEIESRITNRVYGFPTSNDTRTSSEKVRRRETIADKFESL